MSPILTTSNEVVIKAKLTAVIPSPPVACVPFVSAVVICSWCVDPSDRPTAKHILECLELMIRDRQQAVHKAQQQQQQEQQQQQQQMLHHTCSSHALTLQTPVASTEGLAAWQARGMQAAALLPAAFLDSGSPYSMLQQQQQQVMRHSSDGMLTAPDQSGPCSNSNSSSGTFVGPQTAQYSGPLLLSTRGDRQGSPSACPHQKYQVVTEPLVFEQQGRKKQQQQQQQERPQRHSRLQQSHLEPSVFIESL
jgi:hypothetical protein